MKKRVIELLAHHYYMKYRRNARIHKIVIDRIDRENFFVQAIVSVIGVPTLYIGAYYNKRTGSLETWENIWRGEEIN